MMFHARTRDNKTFIVKARDIKEAWGKAKKKNPKTWLVKG
jgi:hypothetical protein